MEAFTGGKVTCTRRRYYLILHPNSKHMFKYVGNGKYEMTGWESQIERARWVK
jgi:hypothetical protein